MVIGQEPTMTFAPTRTDPRAAHPPRHVAAAVAALVLLVAAGWGALLYEALRTGEGADALFAALCQPVALAGAGGSELAGRIAVSAALWSAMSVAMMVPTAVPMVIAYADLAARRAQEGVASASPLALVAGYLCVWIGVALLAALAQAAVAASIAGLGLPARALAILSGAAIGAAGLYQFSAWKQACLASCRHPLPALEAGRSARFAVVFRLGFSQGVACLGCCGAMMAMMAAVGSMNLVWMAAFALLMTAEKLSNGEELPRAIGVGLVVAGTGVAAGAVGLQPIVAWLSR